MSTPYKNVDSAMVPGTGGSRSLATAPTKQMQANPEAIAFIGAIALVAVAAVAGIVIAIAKEQSMKQPGHRP